MMIIENHDDLALLCSLDDVNYEFISGLKNPLIN